MNLSKTRKLLIAFLLIQMAGIKLIALFPDQIEKYYSRGIYLSISAFLKALTTALPFSLSQLLVFFTVIFLLYEIYKRYKNPENRNRKILVRLWDYLSLQLCRFSILYFFFNAVWGLNYQRNSLENSLEIDQITYGSLDLFALGQKLVDESNRYRIDLNQSMDSSIQFTQDDEWYFQEGDLAFQNLAKEHPFISNPKPSVKSVFFPKSMSWLGITGIFFPFTCEANINMDQPDFKRPFTICHEMGHQAGFGSETDANFIAYMACLRSENTFFKYSASFMALRYTLAEIHRQDSLQFQALLLQLNRGILLDLEASTLYWEKFEGPFEKIAHAMNHAYLKANGQKEGTKSYSLMVQLLLKMHLKNKSTVSSTPKSSPQKHIEKPNLETQLNKIPYLLDNYSFTETEIIATVEEGVIANNSTWKQFISLPPNQNILGRCPNSKNPFVFLVNSQDSIEGKLGWLYINPIDTSVSENWFIRMPYLSDTKINGTIQQGKIFWTEELIPCEKPIVCDTIRHKQSINY